MQSTPQNIVYQPLEKGFASNRTWSLISHVYNDGDDWKSTDSFGRNDLPLLVKAVLIEAKKFQKKQKIEHVC